MDLLLLKSQNNRSTQDQQTKTLNLPTVLWRTLKQGLISWWRKLPHILHKNVPNPPADQKRRVITRSEQWGKKNDWEPKKSPVFSRICTLFILTPQYNKIIPLFLFMKTVWLTQIFSGCLCLKGTVMVGLTQSQITVQDTKSTTVPKKICCKKI